MKPTRLILITILLPFSLTEFGVASACDIAKAINASSNRPKITKTISLDILKENSPEVGQWRVLKSGKKTIAIERQGNFESGFIVSRYVKLQGGGLAVKFDVHDYGTDSDDTYFYVFCDNRTYLSIPGPDDRAADESFSLAQTIKKDFYEPEEIKRFVKEMVAY
jgi:hypothetical protein